MNSNKNKTTKLIRIWSLENYNLIRSVEIVKWIIL